MPEVQAGPRVRPLDELDLGAITGIDERISGRYRPEVWEERVAYYLRRDPDSSQVVEVGGKVVGFMLGDIRNGEFGIEEPSGWIERFGIDPDHRGQDLGKHLFAAVTTHFRNQGVRTLRTLVNNNDEGVSGFLKAMGFKAAALTALEMTIAEPSSAKASP
jgi:ribosomal protein S18 acetylase RimI-like enzyme